MYILDISIRYLLDTDIPILDFGGVTISPILDIPILDFGGVTISPILDFGGLDIYRYLLDIYWISIFRSLKHFYVHIGYIY